MLNSHHLLHFNIAFQFKIITLKKNNSLTFRCNSLMKELWVLPRVILGSENSWILYYEFISPSSNKLSVVSITENYLAVKWSCSFHYAASHSSIINLVIVLIVCCEIDMPRYGLDAFSFRLLKQRGNTPSLPLPWTLCIFIGSWSKHVLADDCLLLAVQFVLGS